ncbi:MAG: 3-phosphoshikimate 1-carboxyvinyltransferase [Orrella sp.]|jgi:3-phosphoshikimate 1-carboxyvinyltransferase|uniref:3-phosphoshikimate 1-carboxyvinyltransferase n=1 Tax=Orrella sp. TaxID=1921583 RepID=UPI003BCB759A
MTLLDRLTLAPAQHASGQISLPGSKSISNRVLLLSALCVGTTRIDGILHSDDTRVMLEALDTLGVTIEHVGQSAVRITSPGLFTNKKATLFLGNAGTAFRPLTAALAFAGGDYTLSGVARMHERPIGDLVDALVALGARIDYLGNPGYPPLAIGASKASGHRVQVNGAVSSQFLTALLMASPLIVAQTGQDLTIAVVGELISKPYINITINLMARFGVRVTALEEAAGNLSFHIDRNAHYTSPNEITVEGDASSASYFLALGLIGQGPISVLGVSQDSIQGDVRFVDTLTHMGATVNDDAQTISVSGRAVWAGERLHAFDQDFNLIPDAAMTAAVLAIYADGPCTLRNIGSWRVKETDRIHAMATELRKLGAKVSSGEDWLTVHPIASDAWRPATIHTYDDHRMAMCFSLATFGPVPITIEDPGCVAKTFPDYFDQYHRLVT